MPDSKSQHEYAAAKSSAALFGLPDRAHIELTGADRTKFLHNFCTNDILGLKPGAGCEAFLTNVQGKVLAHVFVFADADSLWLESVPGSAAKIIAHLSKYQINEDVAFHDRTPDRGTLHVAGPTATEMVSRAAIAVAALQPLNHVWVIIAESKVHVRRNDWLGLPGYTLVVERTAVEELRQRLLHMGIIAASDEVFHALRIEAGTPLYGQDITDANLAPEAGRNAQAICYTKGCYLGQEPIARIDALGHVNQELRSLRVEGTSVPTAGSEVLSTDTPMRIIGHVTSAALSYANESAVALGYLKRGFLQAGTRVHIRNTDQLSDGTVFESRT